MLCTSCGITERLTCAAGCPPCCLQARALWRTDGWAGKLVTVVIADGVLPPVKRPGRRPLAACWKALQEGMRWAKMGGKK